MQVKKDLSKIEATIIYLAFVIFLSFQYRSSFNREEVLLFIELLASFVWAGGLLLFARLRFRLYLFEPLSIISVLYLSIFVIKPLIDLHNNKLIEHGVRVINGGGKATAIFLVGYTIFFICYYMRHRVIRFRAHVTDDPGIDKPLSGNLSQLYIAWIMTYILSVACLLSQGLSLRYIFSFGSDGIREDSGNTALLFLSNFGITMLSIWLMILDKSEKRSVKILTTAFVLIYVLMRNARWLMLVVIVAPVTAYYTKRKSEPNILITFILCIAGLTLFAWMQVNRNILYAGGAMQGWGDQGFSLSILLAPLESDLNTYRTFYAMTQRFPSQYSYMLGKTFLYTFILFVPRAIWPGKPDNPVRDMIEHSLNKRARISGTAVANIGEFYANFGILGVAIGMYLLGWIASEMKRRLLPISEYYKDETGNKRLMYAILFPLCFQWIARGNFSGNFYMTIFAVLPFVVSKIRFKKRGVI